MKFYKIFIIILVSLSFELIAQENDNLFFYIPDNEEMSYYLNMYYYLQAWDNNEIFLDSERISFLFLNYVGKNTLQSLLFESFLRYTKNKNIHDSILDLITKNKMNTTFTDSLIKLYASVPVPIQRQSDGKDVIQYNYNNLFFDENINLFSFNEMGFFNWELGMLLFNNNWDILSLNNPSNSNFDSFFIIYGGGTNSMTINFIRYSNVYENDIDTILSKVHYTENYKENWIINELPMEGILSRANADRYIIAYGIGPDNNINTIETGTFVAYLYNKQNNLLYEISIYMNFSRVNIQFLNRNRIFNFLFFQTLFIFLK